MVTKVLQRVHVVETASLVEHMKALDIIDFSTTSAEDAYETLSKAAGSTGKLFERFYAEPELATRLNNTYGTYTIVLQDRTVGGLEFDIDGKWVQVPAAVDAVVSWGWCASVLSNDAIKAAKHRVMNTKPLVRRRSTAVVFVAPNFDQPLQPAGGVSVVWRPEIAEGKVSVGQFKEVISKKWRRREGNEEGEVIEGAQDREVEAFLKK